VDTCQYNDKRIACNLDSIQVTPLEADARTPEDSMCQSFRRKDG